MSRWRTVKISAKWEGIKKGAWSSFTHQSLPRWEAKDINNDFEEKKEEEQ
jgi:hypothetical protein